MDDDEEEEQEKSSAGGFLPLSPLLLLLHRRNPIKVMTVISVSFTSKRIRAIRSINGRIFGIIHRTFPGRKWEGEEEEEEEEAGAGGH